MAHFIQAHTANEAWLKALDLIRKSPAAVVLDGRGGRTTELLHLTMTIEDPRQRWVFARQPVINPAFALAEAVWILSGRNDSGVLNFFNRDLSKYAGCEETFYGAYGHRLRSKHGFDQLERAYQTLMVNTSSRQVVLQIWDAESDLPNVGGTPRSEDIPCNTQSILRIQNGKLYWLQIMRSNDIYRGLPYNIVQFTTLHEVLAGWLGLDLGHYTHVVNCFHYYHSDLEKLERTTNLVAVPNNDTLFLPKNESDLAFDFLNRAITGAAENIQTVNTFAQQLDSVKLPAAFKNIGNVVLAEAARRHQGYKLAAHRLSLVKNPCLHHLEEKCLERFMK